MLKRKNSSETLQEGLDMFSPKRGRGRPQLVVPSEISGRAKNYRGILDHVWNDLWVPLSTAKTEEDVVKAFQNAIPNDTQFSGLASLILAVLREKNFPKRRNAQIGFLAESIASFGIVAPRRSRDICAEERARQKRTHHIIRYEYYVECSCGYKGRSLDHACRKCRAPIPFDEELFMNTMR